MYIYNVYIYTIYNIYIYRDRYHHKEIQYGGCNPVVAADPDTLDEFEWDATSMRRIASACRLWYEMCIHMYIVHCVID